MLTKYKNPLEPWILKLMWPLLAALSVIYHGGLIFDRWVRSKKQFRFQVPVISVGNLTVGGTGKTPLLIKLAKDLQDLGIKPAILTRGYRGLGQWRGIQGNDEAMLLTRYLSGIEIGIGSNRVKKGETIFSRKAANLFILDDGFQHWPIARNLDIVCIDATDPFGGGHLLPWGRLREPLKALRRSQLIVLTRAELADEKALREIKEQISSVAKGAQVLVSRFESSLKSWGGQAVRPDSVMKGRRVLALSAIGNPSAFERTLSNMGFAVIPFRFPDHHEFDDVDLMRVLTARRNQMVVVTTEKDEVKLRKISRQSLQDELKTFFILKVALRFAGDDQSIWGKTLKGIKVEI